MGRWYYPLDPECPEVEEFYSVDLNDPITAMAGIGEELTRRFESKHRAKCERCQEYGAANVDVEY